MKYAFAHMNFFDNELKIEIIDSNDDPIETAKRALQSFENHSYYGDDGHEAVEFSSLEELHEATYNCDILFDIVELAE